MPINEHEDRSIPELMSKPTVNPTSHRNADFYITQCFRLLYSMLLFLPILHIISGVLPTYMMSRGMELVLLVTLPALRQALPNHYWRIVAPVATAAYLHHVGYRHFETQTFYAQVTSILLLVTYLGALRELCPNHVFHVINVMAAVVTSMGFVRVLSPFIRLALSLSMLVAAHETAPWLVRPFLAAASALAYVARHAIEDPESARFASLAIGPLAIATLLAIHKILRDDTAVPVVALLQQACAYTFPLGVLLSPTFLTWLLSPLFVNTVIVDESFRADPRLRWLEWILTPLLGAPSNVNNMFGAFGNEWIADLMHLLRHTRVPKGMDALFFGLMIFPMVLMLKAYYCGMSLHADGMPAAVVTPHALSRDAVLSLATAAATTLALPWAFERAMRAAQDELDILDPAFEPTWRLPPETGLALAAVAGLAAFLGMLQPSTASALTLFLPGCTFGARVFGMTLWHGGMHLMRDVCSVLVLVLTGLQPHPRVQPGKLWCGFVLSCCLYLRLLSFVPLVETLKRHALEGPEFAELIFWLDEAVTPMMDLLLSLCVCKWLYSGLARIHRECMCFNVNNVRAR